MTTKFVVFAAVIFSLVAFVNNLIVPHDPLIKIEAVEKAVGE
jgi:hypothetical protein